MGGGEGFRWNRGMDRFPLPERCSSRGEEAALRIVGGGVRVSFVGVTTKWGGLCGCLVGDSERFPEGGNNFCWGGEKSTVWVFVCRFVNFTSGGEARCNFLLAVRQTRDLTHRK
jgi:hypothetical protein